MHVSGRSQAGMPEDLVDVLEAPRKYSLHTRSSGQSLYSVLRLREVSGICSPSTMAKYGLFDSRPYMWLEDFMVETFVALRDKPPWATVESFAKTVQSVRA
ncbi:hypothetical protein EV363DRAFT_1291570 [Boletus edulis]|nr:hypothetical protein EV363DRAFT_1291570 [Boletus edulis]